MGSCQSSSFFCSSLSPSLLVSSTIFHVHELSVFKIIDFPGSPWLIIFVLLLVYLLSMYFPSSLGRCHVCEVFIVVLDQFLFTPCHDEIPFRSVRPRLYFVSIVGSVVIVVDQYVGYSGMMCLSRQSPWPLCLFQFQHQRNKFPKRNNNLVVLWM